MPIGAAIACVERIRPSWIEKEFRHSVTAFGAGALLSAVALTLVTDGIANLKPLFASILIFCRDFGFYGFGYFTLQNENTSKPICSNII